MKYGVRGHDLGIQDNIPCLANAIKQLGFDFIQLVLKKTLINETINLNDDIVKRIKEDFEKQKVEIALLGAYFNPIHSDRDKVQKDIHEFKTFLKYANQFGCKYVGTETGSYNDDQWTYHPNNHSEEAYQNVVKIVKELVVEAEKFDAYVAIEPAYNHVICSPERLQRLVDDVNSEHLIVIIDIYNLLTIDNYHEYKQIFIDYVHLFKEKIKIFHFKDFVVDNHKLIKVGLGEGTIDYRYILHVIQEILPDSVAVFEGVPEDKLASSLAYIKSCQDEYLERVV